MRYSQFSRRCQWRQSKLRTRYEDLRRGDFSASQGARSNPEGVSCAGQEKDGIAIGIAYINDIEHDRRNPPSPDFVAQIAAVLGVPLEVLQYYAGRLPSDKKTGDPSHERIVAAYRAFRREIDKKRR
jgi:hypothetical protein